MPRVAVALPGRQTLRRTLDNEGTVTWSGTGDIHSGWACELPYDPASYPVGDSAG